MESNRELLKKLENIDDETLKKAAFQIAKALGANPLQAHFAAANLNDFKQRAASLTDAELSEAASKIPPEKAEELKKMLGISDKKEGK